MNNTPATSDRPKESGQSLPKALQQTFEAYPDAAFAQSFVGLVAALVNTRQVALFGPPVEDGAVPTPLASTLPNPPSDAYIAAAAACFARETKEPASDNTYVTCPIALPLGGTAALVLEPPQGSGVGRALAYERVTVLQELAQARFQNPELNQLRRTMSAALALADPNEQSLQAFADQLSSLTEADYAAVGQFDGTRIGLLAVSGQGDGATRAALPDQLRRDMAETGRKKLAAPLRHFMAPPGQDHGLVLDLAGPKRNRDLITLVAAAATAVAPTAVQRRSLWKRSRKWVISLIALAGVALIPLPDEVSLNATVTAEEFRIVTAPFTAALVEISVQDNSRVEAGDTLLATLDTAETVNELIAAQADYAAALLQRETSRASRDAAALRNAELEVERIAARIALLNTRRDAAKLTAPIDGLVIGPDLQAKRGAVVRQGDPLLQIADPSQVRLDVEVGQDDLARIAQGMEGRFRPDFDPSLTFDVALTSVSPAALDTDRSPVFRAQAGIAGDPNQLRHGMSGVISVDRKWRLAGLILWDALRDWVLLRLWL